MVPGAPPGAVPEGGGAGHGEGRAGEGGGAGPGEGAVPGMVRAAGAGHGEGGGAGHGEGGGCRAEPLAGRLIALDPVPQAVYCSVT